MSDHHPPLDVGDEIPSFDLDSQVGRIYFREIIAGRWTLLVTFNTAFDPVATTDFGAICKLHDEFQARNIFIIAIGNDSVPNYRKWIRDVEELQTVRINFAVMSDPSASVLKMFGLARDNVLSKKSEVVSMGAFLIDLDGRIRFSIRNSSHIGRNWYEFLRQYDALMVVTYHPVICPSNWGQGQQVMIKKDVSSQEATEYRPVEIKPWFKIAPCPEKL